MAVSASWYGQGVKKALTGSIDLDSDTLYVMLATNVYAPNVDTDDFRDDVSANEIAGAGYSAGGQALTSVAVTYDAASNEIRFDFDDPTWTGASFTCRYLVVYKHRGGAASADELIMYVDFGGDETVASGTFIYQVPATGAGKATVV